MFLVLVPSTMCNGIPVHMPHEITVKEGGDVVVSCNYEGVTNSANLVIKWEHMHTTSSAGNT